MPDSEKTGVTTSPSQDWVAQIRQISVPVWARFLALVLSLAVLLPGIVLIWGGWLGCTEFLKSSVGAGVKCHEIWIAQGIEIVVAALVPVVVILYLVFAETGIRSLTRRTNELLGKIVPQALRSDGGIASSFADRVMRSLTRRARGLLGKLVPKVLRSNGGIACSFADGVASCTVAEPAHIPGSLSAHYRLHYRLDENGGNDGMLLLTVAVNVDKAVIVFFLPQREEVDPKTVQRLMVPTIRGATHEGYVFDDELVLTSRENQRYLQLIARRSLPADFLWNPAAKLHFSWDLRSFAYSVIHDAHSLLRC